MLILVLAIREWIEEPLEIYARAQLTLVGMLDKLHRNRIFDKNILYLCLLREANKFIVGLCVNIRGGEQNIRKPPNIPQSNATTKKKSINSTTRPTQ